MLNPMAKLDIYFTHHLCLYSSRYCPLKYIYFYLNISTSLTYIYLLLCCMKLVVHQENHICMHDEKCLKNADRVSPQRKQTH